MLGDLADQRLAVAVGHLVARLDPAVGGEQVAEGLRVAGLAGAFGAAEVVAVHACHGTSGCYRLQHLRRRAVTHGRGTDRMGSHEPGPTADVSVRVAWADDADGDRRRCRCAPGRCVYADLLPARGARRSTRRAPPTSGGRRWPRPQDARNRVLVALERNRVVGFAITAPAADPDCDPVADAELMELTVDPRRARQGPRLAAAAGGRRHMQADRFSRAVLWAVASDDALRALPHRAPAGRPTRAHRELDLDGDGTTLVKQVRLHTGNFLVPPLDFPAERDTMEVRQRASRSAPSGPERGNALLAPLPRLYRIVLDRRRPRPRDRSPVPGSHSSTDAARRRRPRRQRLPGSLIAYLLVHDFHHRAASGAGAAPALSRAPQPVASGRPEPDAPAWTHASGAAIIRDGLGVGIATGAYGVSFGAVSVAAGLSVAQTCALSLLMFTGASQFALVGVVAAGGAPRLGRADRAAARHPQHALRPAAGSPAGLDRVAPGGGRPPAHRRVHGDVGDPGVHGPPRGWGS